MIFTKENIELIRQGRKTETRRIWKKPHVKVGKVYQCRTTRYAKTPDDSPYIKITAMRQEKLGDITIGAISREGYMNDGTVLNITEQSGKFHQLWAKLHGEWNPEQIVTVIDFKVVK